MWKKIIPLAHTVWGATIALRRWERAKLHHIFILISSFSIYVQNKCEIWCWISEMLAKLCFTVLEEWKRGTQYLQQSLLSTSTQDVGMPKSDNTQWSANTKYVWFDAKICRSMIHVPCTLHLQLIHYLTYRDVAIEFCISYLFPLSRTNEE